MHVLKHPLFPGDYPDPSILKDGADYWLTHSSFNYGPGLLIWHSTDLVNWTPVTHALSSFGGDVWAPEITKYKSRYYLYYKSTGGNWGMVADDPRGPWSEPQNLSIPGIDPGHIVDTDGTRLLHISDGRMVEISEDGLEVTSEVEKVVEPWPIPEDRVIEVVGLEGPKLFWKDGWCHMLVAQGGTAGPATSHMVVHARSRSARGPWEFSPHNPVIATGSREERWWSRGHGSLVEGPDGIWYCLYHAYDRDAYTLGRQTLIEPVEWTEDGWFRLPASRTPNAPARLPAAPQSEAPNRQYQWEDSFAEGAPSWHWRFWKGDGKGRASKASGGGLRLEASEKDLSAASPMVCVAGHLSYKVEVELEISEGAIGGVLLFYNEACHGGWVTDGTSFRKALRGWISREAIPHRKGPIALRLINDRHQLTGFFRQPDGDWQRFPNGFETSAWHHNAFGGFLSLRPALISFGAEGSAVTFRNWRYEGLPSI